MSLTTTPILPTRPTPSIPDNNTYLADPANPIYSRYAMVNHGTDAEARLLADGWQELVSTKDLVVYERVEKGK